MGSRMPITPRTATADAYWVAAPGRGEIRREALPPRAEDEVIVEALYSGISRGTESLVFSGRVPPSEYTRMRAPFQSGDFPAPVKYGYASVGRVVEGPSALLGRIIFCLHPHQTRYVVPASAVHPLPDDVPPDRAVLAANLETAVNGLWDGAPAIGDRIAVVGAGTVGSLVAWLAAAIPGARVELIDVDGDKRRLAETLGVRFASPETASPDADLVIHASGAPEGLATALALAGFEAKIVEMSWYGDRPVAIPLGGAFHSRRLVISSSQVGTIAPRQRARWTASRRMALALRLLAEPRLDALITGESPFTELPAVMAALSAAPAGTLCHRLRYTP